MHSSSDMAPIFFSSPYTRHRYFIAASSVVVELLYSIYSRSGKLEIDNRRAKGKIFVRRFSPADRKAAAGETAAPVPAGRAQGPVDRRLAPPPFFPIAGIVPRAPSVPGGSPADRRGPEWHRPG